MPQSFILLLLGLLITANAQVTLQFSTPAAALTNLSDNLGVAGINGLAWGIIVDSDENGFGTIDTDPSAPCQLVSGEELSPGDFFFYAGVTTPFPIGPEAGPGSATTSIALDVYSIPEISNGDPFALVWFDQGIAQGSNLAPGAKYGIITDPTFTLPSNGSSNAPYSSIFAGADPVRPTNQTVQSIIPPSTTSSIITVDPGGGDPTTQNLAFQFPVSVINDNSGTLTYKLWKSTDLTNWSVATMTPETLSDDGTTRVLQLTDPDPVGDDPSGRRFLRLEITP